MFSSVATAEKVAAMTVHDNSWLKNKEMLSALIQSHLQIQDDLIYLVTWLDQGTEHYHALETMVVIEDRHGLRIMLKITVAPK